MNSTATTKIVLDTKHKNDEEKLLKIRVTYCGEPRLYSIGDSSKRLTPQKYQKQLGSTKTKAMRVAKDAQDIADEVIKELGTHFTFDAFRKRYKRKLLGRSDVSYSLGSLLSDYFEHHNLAYKTKKSYETSVNWVIRYKEKATISSITPEFVEGLISFMEEEHLKKHGCEMSKNTRNIYLRQLRAIYNFAIKHEYTNNKNPFAIKNLGSIGRRNAALSEQELIQLIEYIPKNKSEEMGKDYFMLTLHCFGANIGDILLLRNSNIENDTVSFIRRKTKSKNAKPIEFRLTNTAKTLFNKYGKILDEAPNSLILPYLANATSEGNLENRIKRVNREINAGLKSICKTLGWRKITTYNARHTFATIFMNRKRPIEEIQRYLGHTNCKTTESYLHNLSSTILDEGMNILENLGSKK